MRKIVLAFIVMFSFVSSVSAQIKEVEFKKCVDGDTATLVIDGEDKKVRLLAVDTPETVHPTKGEESGGKTASDFTCNSLKSANKIEIEYDPKSDKTDKYDRELVWLYIDGELFQEKLVSEGYAEVAYIYGDYLYVDKLCRLQETAISDKLGIWYDGKREVGYCKTKNNTTSKTTKEVDVIELIEDEEYDKALDKLLDNFPFGLAVIILLVLIILLKYKKKF